MRLCSVMGVGCVYASRASRRKICLAPIGRQGSGFVEHDANNMGFDSCVVYLKDGNVIFDGDKWR